MPDTSDITIHADQPAIIGILPQTDAEQPSQPTSADAADQPATAENAERAAEPSVAESPMPPAYKLVAEADDCRVSEHKNGMCKLENLGRGTEGEFASRSDLLRLLERLPKDKRPRNLHMKLIEAWDIPTF